MIIIIAIIILTNNCFFISFYYDLLNFILELLSNQISIQLEISCLSLFWHYKCHFLSNISLRWTRTRTRTRLNRISFLSRKQKHPPTASFSWYHLSINHLVNVNHNHNHKSYLLYHWLYISTWYLFDHQMTSTI